LGFLVTLLYVYELRIDVKENDGLLRKVHDKQTPGKPTTQGAGADVSMQKIDCK